MLINNLIPSIKETSIFKFYLNNNKIHSLIGPAVFNKISNKNAEYNIRREFINSKYSLHYIIPPSSLLVYLNGVFYTEIIPLHINMFLTIFNKLSPTSIINDNVYVPTINQIKEFEKDVDNLLLFV